MEKKIIQFVTIHITSDGREVIEEPSTHPHLVIQRKIYAPCLEWLKEADLHVVAAVENLKVKFYVKRHEFLFKMSENH